MTRSHLVRRAAAALAAGFAVTALVPAASASAQAANDSYAGRANAATAAAPAATERYIRSYYVNIQNCYRDGDAGIQNGLWDRYTCRNTGGPLGLPRRDLWVSP